MKRLVVSTLDPLCSSDDAVNFGGSIFDFVKGWLNDPQASSALFIALVAAIFAVYQLRSFPAERRRRVLDVMIQKYAY